MASDGFLFDLSAALWRKSITDEKALLEALAVRLEQALPTMTTVERRMTLFSKNKPVRSVTVKFEGAEYRVALEGSGILAEKGKIVRNIRLKTEHLTLSQWLTELSSDLESYAQEHESTRQTLERFLLGD
ncbi:hypothetical protein LLE49_05745 [Alicyclobacillus tolerans]|uniref:hypothetical protein n=1 Tax=Alicyclobacillus tolerans TaxID=90970 RepID=UPI001F2DDCA2|nr:hypothetical protein [Alicyclobacillus tolerans]MCF8564244.1 hypothetical protein [Alicyclobacillus tolerans]